VNLLRDFERVITDRLAVCNAMSLYFWSKTFNLPSLRRVSMIFMVANWEDIIRLPETEAFVCDNPAMHLKVNAKIFRHFAGGE
jgi:hypothetical protein